jgi:hypothetical protein
VIVEDAPICRKLHIICWATASVHSRFEICGAALATKLWFYLARSGRCTSRTLIVMMCGLAAGTFETLTDRILYGVCSDGLGVFVPGVDDPCVMAGGV